MYAGINYGGWGLLLLSLGIGYIICVKASKDNATLYKYGGYAIGIIMIAFSIMLSIFNLMDTVTTIQKAIKRSQRSTMRSTTRPARERPKNTAAEKNATGLQSKIGLPRPALGVRGESAPADSTGK